MVVTTSIELERMLLHSGATSSVNPGICTKHASLRHRNANCGEEQTSGGSGASLQQAYDRIHHEVRKRNHPEQETKSK